MLNVGDVRVCWAQFFALDKSKVPAESRALADPTTITLTVTPPSGAPQVYSYPGTIVRQGLGTFTQDVPCTLAGTWTAKWEGTGGAAGVEPDSWTVQA